MVNASSNAVLRDDHTPQEASDALPRIFNGQAANDANFIPKNPYIGVVPVSRGQVAANDGSTGGSTAAYNKGYAVGNRIGTNIRNAKNAITSAPENARLAVQRKQDEVKQSINNAKNAIINAPENVTKAVKEKRSAVRNDVGVGSRASLRQTQRVGDRDVQGPRLNSRRLVATGSQSTPKNLKEFGAAANSMAVKGGPVLFWLVAGCAVVKDIIDVISALFDALGVMLTATIAGSVVGIPLTVFSEVLDKFSGLFIDFTVVAYFGYIGGGFALRFVIMSIGALIDAIPGLDVLPLTTVTFFMAYLLGRTAQKIVQSSAVANTLKVARVAGRVVDGVGSVAGRVAARLAR